MDRASILSKQVKKFSTLKAVVIFSALLSLTSTFSLATQGSTAITNQNTIIAQEKPWKVWRTADNLKASYRDSSIKNLIEIKAQATIESNLAGFICFLEDLAKTPNWLDNAKSAKLISQIAANEYTFITGFKSVWPFSAREIVAHSRYWQNQDLSIDILVNDAGDLIAKTKNVIRMKVISAHWKVVPTKPDQIAITYQFIVNPKGSIPKWLAKPIAFNSIWTTLKNMRAQIPKSKCQQQVNDNIQEIQKK
jgi:hypothetical protein